MAVVALLLVVVVVVVAARDPPAGAPDPAARRRAGRAASPTSPAAPRFHRVAWAAALSFAGQFIYVSAASIIVVDLLGLGELDFWILFAPLVGAVLRRVADQQLGRRAGSGQPAGDRLAALLRRPRRSSTRRSPPPLGPVLPLGGARARRCSRLGTVAAYPTMQLILLDMFPAGRGSAVSLFTFFTLLLNGLIASLLAPRVTGSLTTLAAGIDGDRRRRAGAAGSGTHLAARCRPRGRR